MWRLSAKILLPIAFLVTASTVAFEHLPTWVGDNRGKISLALLVLLNILIWPPHDQTWRPFSFEGTGAKKWGQILVVIVLHLLFVGFILAWGASVRTGGFRGTL